MQQLLEHTSPKKMQTERQPYIWYVSKILSMVVCIRFERVGLPAVSIQSS